MTKAVCTLLAVVGLLLLTAGCSTDGAQRGETTLDQESLCRAPLASRQTR